MNMQHHSDQEFQAQQRFVSELLGRAKPNFPAGKISENDLGELSFAVAADIRKQVVIIRYAKAVDWVGLDSKSARYLAGLLSEKADQLDAGSTPEQGSTP